MTVSELVAKLQALHGDLDLRVAFVDLMLVGPKHETLFDHAEIVDVRIESGGHVVVAAAMYDGTYAGEASTEPEPGEPPAPPARPS